MSVCPMRSRELIYIITTMIYLIITIIINIYIYISRLQGCKVSRFQGLLKDVSRFKGSRFQGFLKDTECSRFQGFQG